jgi:hypothetical protein
MRTIETSLYQFDELGESAKEKARDWYRQADAYDDYFSESVIEDAATIADLIGIDLRQKPVKLMNGTVRYDPAVYFSGFSSQGDGASFEGSYRYKKGAAKAIRAYAPQDRELHRIADELQALQARNFYRLRASIGTSGRYCHEYSMDVNVEYAGDDYRDVSAVEDDVTELMRDFARWIYRALERAYDYENSDEAVDETIRANEYEFEEDGARA